MKKLADSKISDDDISALINNGFDFLEKAQTEFESDPKHSVVSFWAAVEILLKVPLLNEHWTLITANKGKLTSRYKYESGDFISVSFDETCIRLADILQTPLPDKSKKAFDAIRKHRNRVVHFYHSEFTEAHIETILAEQTDAWFALHRFIIDQWKSVFSRSDRKNRVASRELVFLRVNKHYSSAKFRHIEPELKALKKSGISFSVCNTCHCKSAVTERSLPDKEHYVDNCRVCGAEERFVMVTCRACDNEQPAQRLGPYDADFTCKHCGDSQQYYELLSDDFWTKDNYFETDTPASCSECESYHSVCHYGDKYLCTICLSVHDEIYFCGYCSEPITDLHEHSDIVGCSFCDGHRGFADDEYAQ
jgi:hypothetical protein